MDCHRHFLLCECASYNHQMGLSYFDGDDDPTLFVHFHLIAWQNFFRRLRAGLRYAFGFRSRYGNWDEILVNPKEAERLQRFIGEFLATVRKEDDANK